MAIAIIDSTNGICQCIADSENDITSYVLSSGPNLVSATISDSDYEQVRQNFKSIQYENGNVTVVDEDQTPQTAWDHNSELELQAWFDLFSERLKPVVELRGWGDKQIIQDAVAYDNFCKAFDKSSVTYPINWEKHCADNNINYFAHLQID